jgi:ureidoacrylate peracid hydrolase
MVEFPVNPRKIALLNVDLQNLFVEGYPLSVPDGPTVVAQVNRLAAACRKARILVIHTIHALRADSSDAGVMGEFFPLTREGLLARDTHATHLHPALEVAPEDIVLEKPRFGAFQGTYLESLLRSRGVEAVIVTGVSTNVCAETTAREANVRDFRVFFIEDATATRDTNGISKEELQRATCAILGFAFAQVLTVDEMIRRIQASC